MRPTSSTRRPPEAAGGGLAPSHRAYLDRQHALSYAIGLTLLWPVTVAWLRLVRGYRIRDLRAVRRRLLELLEQAPGPVLVCPNHLTWIDSLLVQWALASPGRLFRSFRLFAWNVPEQSNFGSSWLLRLYCYLGKCVPIRRGGDRDEQNLVMEKLRHLLECRELVTIYPEGGRGRNGRITIESITYGVGRIAMTVSDCRVLCVYLRGERQEGSSVLPARGQAFDVELELIDPRPRVRKRGLRAARESSLRIGEELVRLEQRYFAGR